MMWDKSEIQRSIMSMRPAQPKLPQPKNFLSVSTSIELPTPETNAVASEETLKMSDLTPTERSAASLGVDPDAWRPIGWMNEVSILPNNTHCEDV